MTSFWDVEARSYDEAADHGLADFAVRGRWEALLGQLLPACGSILDMGCGTGSLAVLMATMGYRVSGLDLSPQMLIRAREKAKRAGVDIAFVNGDATHPGQPPGIFDVVFGRHILWTLPEPRAVLERWEALLAPMGRIVLIEGFWSTGVGMRMEHVRSALPRTLHLAVEADISRDRELWARDVTDERFAIAAIKRG